MSRIRTSLPIPTQPWEAAKSRFLDGLSAEETKRFKDATLENLFYGASSAQKKHAQNSRTWLLQERLSSLVDAVDDYGKALDVFANTYGLIMSPIWGSLRVVLHIAGEAGKFQERLVEMLAQIGDSLPRFRIYQILFHNHERLLVALSDAYLDVLKFCGFTKDFFLQAKRSMIPISIVLKGAWKSFRRDFEAYMVAFRQHSKRVEKEAALAHMIESARIREIEIANRALQIKNMNIARRHRILSSLPAVDYVNKHSQKSRLRHPGTTKWLLDTPQYKSWYSSPASACFYCYGIPGSGKSVLSASLVDSLLEGGAQSETSLVCYYYCDCTEGASLESISLIASLLQQVIQTLPLHRFGENFLCHFDNGKCLPALSDCEKSFIGLLKEFKTTYVIIDGIDELASEGRVFVLALIKHLLRLAPVTTRIFATNRLGEYAIHNSLKRHISLKITKELIDKDISLFISEQIENIAHENPVLNNRKLKQDIIGALTEGANGMFLWVRFQLFDVSEALTESEIRACLRNLPQDLSETYSRIIAKIHNAPSGHAKFDMMQKVFRWVTGARRPLRIEELEEAVGLDKSDTCLRRDRTASGTGERLIGCCGNLVVLNEEDGTVVFAHQTVHQYLCSSTTFQGSSDSRTSRPTSIASLNFSTADKDIGEICLAYLNFVDFDTQLARVQETTNIDRTQAEQLVWASVPLAASIRGLVSWTQGWRGRSQAKPESQIKFAMPVATKPSQTLEQNYALLDYVITFWPFHTAQLREEDVNWTKFTHVALHRQLAFEFRPWNEVEHRQRVEDVAKYLQYHVPNPLRRRLGVAAALDWISQDMLLYSWSLRHGISSLLKIVDQKSLTPYLQLVSLSSFPTLNLQLMASTFGPRDLALVDLGYLIKSIVVSNPPSKTGFWHGSLIVHSACEYMKDFPNDRDKIGNLFDCFTIEFVNWVDNANSSSLEEVFRDAVIMASQLDDNHVFAWLVPHCINSYKSLADIMVAILQRGSIQHHVVRTLLDHEILYGELRPSTEWQLLFALLECVPIMESIISAATILEPKSTTMKRLYLIIVLATNPRPKIIRKLLHSLEGPQRQTYLSQRPANWSSMTFATVETGERFAKLEGKDVIREATKIQEIADLFGRVHKMLQVEMELIDLSYAIRHDALFSAAAFESDGIHCLEWAIIQNGADGWRLFEVLVPYYAPLMRDEKKNSPIVSGILKSTINADPDMLVLLVPLMPDRIFFKIIRELKHPSPSIRVKHKEWEQWLLLRAQDRPSGVPFMEWLGTPWQQNGRLHKTEWIEIIRFAFEVWRESV